jgi:hypothetical protein
MTESPVNPVPALVERIQHLEEMVTNLRQNQADMEQLNSFIRVVIQKFTIIEVAMNQDKVLFNIELNELKKTLDRLLVKQNTGHTTTTSSRESQ